MEDLPTRHAPIRELLGRDAGIALQRIDAGMVLDISLSLFDEAIPVLPEHASFVCRLADESRVDEAMDNVLDRRMTECPRKGVHLPRCRNAAPRAKWTTLLRVTDH